MPSQFGAEERRYSHRRVSGAYERMLTMPTKTLLTSRDKKGLHIVGLFEAAFNQAGLDDEGGQRVHERGDEFKAGVLSLLARLSATPLAHDRTKAIMGKNFFGVDEAVKHFGVKPTGDQLAALAQIPFSEETLLECKDSHVLVAVFPLSIVAIRAVAPKKVFCNQDWYDREQFATQAGTVGWKLVRKNPVEGSTSKAWAEQQRLLRKDEETPSAQVVIYTMVGHFLSSGKRLFEKIYVRCSDVDSFGDRVYVGHFDADGLNVNAHWDDYRGDSLGVASARKSNS